jgi:hypothetical protein
MPPSPPRVALRILKLRLDAVAAARGCGMALAATSNVLKSTSMKGR